MFKAAIDFIKESFPEKEWIPLHEPAFFGNEKAYVSDTIDSTFVSSVGEYVNRFEQLICEKTGAQYAVATVNGTSALHMALMLAGVRPGDLVITQALTFIATVNAIHYCGAEPLFLDVDRETMGLSPDALARFLDSRVQVKGGLSMDRKTGKPIRACVPMHTFGHPVKIDQIRDICRQFHLVLVEDAAESLGSFYMGRHTGTFGTIGILSFNGNKIVTCGGGGMIITSDEAIGKRARHLTTTAKRPHPYRYEHDAIGYNYRLPNLNAALGCAQIEQLDYFIENKRKLASSYQAFFQTMGIPFFSEPEHARSNYWLNAIILEDRNQRNRFLEETHREGIMTRPLWDLINDSPMYAKCEKERLGNSRWFEERVVNLPSSVRRP